MPPIRVIEFDTVEEYLKWQAAQKASSAAVAVVAEDEDATHEASKQDAIVTEDFLLAFIDRVLTRLPIPNGQMQLYRALYDADGWLSYGDLGKKMGRQEGLKGILRALQVRIKHTPGADEHDKLGRKGYLTLLFDIEIIGGKRSYRMTPELRRKLEEKGIIAKKPTSP